MNLRHYFPDSTDYVNSVTENLKEDRRKHKGFIRNARTALYPINYLWTPLFLGMDLVFRWIFQIKPAK